MELKYREISPVLAKFLARYGFGEDCAITLAGTAGSRRVYFRLTEGLRTFIVLVSPPDDADFGRFLRITQFYRLLDVHVPMVYCIDDAAHQVVLEDLGDRRLYRPGGGGVEGGRRVRPDFGGGGRPLPHLSAPTATWSTCWWTCRPAASSGTRNARTSIRAISTWTICSGKPATSPPSTWKATGASPSPGGEGRPGGVFRELARRVDAQPKSIMHRDFQSQNLMVQSGGVMRVIDYQGSRLGSVYYDLASLLLDPYVMLPDDTVMRAAPLLPCQVPEPARPSRRCSGSSCWRPPSA